jgi:hypothetical protein
MMVCGNRLYCEYHVAKAYHKIKSERIGITNGCVKSFDLIGSKITCMCVITAPAPQHHPSFLSRIPTMIGMP